MIKLQKIIGMPPKTEHVFTDTRLYDSMPVLELYPMKPKISNGLQFMTLESAYDDYKKILNFHGFDLDVSAGKQCLNICFLHEGSISESFSNDYGDSFLSKFANVASEGISEARQILGASNFDELQKKGQAVAKNIVSKVAGDTIGGFADSIFSGANNILDSGQEFLKNLMGSKAGENLLIGNRLDLPLLWKGSSSTFDYNFSIRLYNPNPSSDSAHEKYIVGPLVALLLFCMPRSNDGVTYKWPFYCTINAPGMFKINHGCIKDISITKGGDGGVFTYSQRPTIIDIKISVTELFSTRVALEEDGVNDVKIPTLHNYIESLREKKPISSISHYTAGEDSASSKITIIKKENEDNNESKIINKPKTNNIKKETKSRVDEVVKKNIIPEIKKVEKQGKLYVEKIKEKTERVIDDIEKKKDELKDNLISQFTDPETGDKIIKIGKNTVINLTKKKAVIDENDFQQENDFKKTVKEYSSKDFNTLITTKQKEIPETIKNTGNEPQTILKNGQMVEKIGENSYVNPVSQTAVLDRNDFKNSFEYKKAVRDYMKKGYNVSHN